MAVVRLDGNVEVKVDATISAHSQIVDTVYPPRKAALTASIHRKVEASALQWDRFLSGKDSVHAHAVICHSGDIEIAFVYLIALHCRILSHCISPSFTMLLVASDEQFALKRFGIPRRYS